MSGDPWEVARYQLRPIVVHAIQYRPDIPNCTQVAAFLGDAEMGCPWGDTPHDDTYWADVEINPGDWIIASSTGKGAIAIVDAHQFAAQYVEVST